MARHMGTKTTTMIRNHYQRQVDGGRSDLKVAAESADRRRREGQYLGPAPQPTPILRRTYDNFPTRKRRAASPPEGENLIGGVSSGSDTDSSPIMFSPVPLVQRVQDAPEPELLENMADAVLYSNSIYASNSEEFLEPQPIRADFSTYDKQLSGRLGRSAREDDAISSANTSKIMAASTGWSLAYANASNGEGFNTHMRYMPPIWGPDQNSQTGLTQEQQNDLMHALESDGMGDVQRMISQTLRDDTWSNSSSAGGPIVPTTLNVGDWYEFFGIPNGSDIK